MQVEYLKQIFEPLKLKSQGFKLAWAAIKRNAQIVVRWNDFKYLYHIDTGNVPFWENGKWNVIYLSQRSEGVCEASFDDIDNALLFALRLNKNEHTRY